MNRKRPALLLVLFGLMSACSESPQRALGTLEWDRVNGRAIASEAITDLLVAEGDAVTRGQALLQLDSRKQASRVIQSEAKIEQLQWRLRELQAGYRAEDIAAAEATYKAAQSRTLNRKTEYDRLRELVQEQLVSEREVDTAKTLWDQAIGDEETALEGLLQLQAGYRVEQIEAARAQLAAEQAVLAYEQQLLDQYTVLAERDGVMETFPFKLGDKPPAGAVVTTVLSGQQPWARVYLPEPWLSQLSVGSEVDVYFDGRSDPMTGRIRHIERRSSFTPYYALAEEDRQRLSYVSEIVLLDEAAKDLPVGIPVQVGLR